jgi:hypothetical protein
MLEKKSNCRREACSGFITMCRTSDLPLDSILQHKIGIIEGDSKDNRHNPGHGHLE